MPSKGLALTKVEKRDLNIHKVGADRPVAFMCARKQGKNTGREGGETEETENDEGSKRRMGRG